jgi:sulfate adenylyltransferase subunit 1 (EFTu-like GTPase family)
MNDIGRVALTLQKPIVCDVYDSHQGTGAFVLIDEATHHTVAAGMIRARLKGFRALDAHVRMRPFCGDRTNGVEANG